MPMLMLLTVLRTPFFSQIRVPEETFLATHQKHLNLEKILQILVQILLTGNKLQSSIFAVAETIMKFDSYQ